MALTDFLNRAQVNNQSAYNYYPVHSFGRLNDRNNKIVRDEVIPHLARELKQAVKDEDSHKIQTYIRALGNLGHPKILSVFEPYLEGQVLVTDFQRMAIVVALDKLTQNYPRLARSGKEYSNFLLFSFQVLIEISNRSPLQDLPKRR